MKKILPILIIAVAVSLASWLLIKAQTNADNGAGYDFSNGQPQAIEDARDGKSPKYDFSNGQPAIADQLQNFTAATPNMTLSNGATVRLERGANIIISK